MEFDEQPIIEFHHLVLNVVNKVLRSRRSYVRGYELEFKHSHTVKLL